MSPAHQDLTLRYRSVLTYLSPESIISVTTFALGPNFFETGVAACTFLPEDVLAKFLAVALIAGPSLSHPPP
jgi:hypothetical protein